MEYAPNKLPTGGTCKGISWDLCVSWMFSFGGCRGISIKENKENPQLDTEQIMKF